MVIGNGMIARALMNVDRADVLFSASGLSNAKGADQAARQREADLLTKHIALNQDKLYVYISSYSLNDKEPALNTPYLTHKLEMEQLVKSQALKYLIVRTSNVVGQCSQPGNLMNFIYHKFKDGTFFEIWTNTARNLIDVHDLAQMLSKTIDKGFQNETVYLTHPKDLPVYDIVRQFEDLKNVKGNYSLTDKGVFYQSDKKLAIELFKELNLEADPIKYTRGLIKKYFMDAKG